MTKNLIAIASASLFMAGWLPSAARADGVKDLEAIVSLNSSATVDIPKDWMTVTFSAAKDGADAQAVQSALKEALGAALGLAQRAARPDGHVEVQTGGFSLQPRFNARGVLTGWSGSTELQVQGRDMTSIAELSGQVSTMSVSRLGYSLSREAREKVEADVSAQAIARFRVKAADVARAFGYSSYVLRDVNVQTDGGQPTPPRLFAMKAAPAALMDDALPVEAGKGTVTATVSGTVQLK